MLSSAASLGPIWSFGGGRMAEPGAGAEEQASRRARKIARLREEAAHGGEVNEALLRRALEDQRAWSVGAEGERQVADVLTKLQRYGWTALHDVRWPGRPQANIDHIAIGPGGVVIIDAKNWSGAVTVRDGVLRQNGYQRGRETQGVAEATAAVTTLLAAQHRTATRAVLCLTSQDQDVETVPGVDIVGRWQLPEHLINLPMRLTVFEVAEIANYLRGQLDRRTQSTTNWRPTSQPEPRRPVPRPRYQPPSRRPSTARKPARSSFRRELANLALTLVGLFVGFSS
jgi:hypothetical protein